MVAPNFKDLREIPASKNSFKRIIRKQIISTYNAWFLTSKNDSLFGISSGAPYQSGEYNIDGAPYQSGELNIDGAPYQSGEHNIDGAPYQSGEYIFNWLYIKVM